MKKINTYQKNFFKFFISKIILSEKIFIALSMLFYTIYLFFLNFICPIFIIKYTEIFFIKKELTNLVFFSKIFIIIIIFSLFKVIFIRNENNNSKHIKDFIKKLNKQNILFLINNKIDLLNKEQQINDLNVNSLNLFNRTLFQFMPNFLCFCIVIFYFLNKNNYVYIFVFLLYFIYLFYNLLNRNKIELEKNDKIYIEKINKTDEYIEKNLLQDEKNINFRLDNFLIEEEKYCISNTANNINLNSDYNNSKKNISLITIVKNFILNNMDDIIFLIINLTIFFKRNFYNYNFFTFLIFYCIFIKINYLIKIIVKNYYLNYQNFNKINEIINLLFTYLK